MNTTFAATEVSLTKLICLTFDVEKDGEDFSLIFSQTLSYLTKGTSYSAYQNCLKPYCKGRGLSAQQFRLKLHESRYLLLHLKLYMLRLARLRTFDVKLAKQLAEEAQVKVIDAKRIVQVFHQHAAMRKRLKLAARKIPKERLHLLTLEGVNKYFSDVVYTPVVKSIDSKVWEKMRFLVGTSNADLRDFNNDVLAKALEAFYKMMPVTDRTDLHFVNGLKQTVKNHVNNMISAEKAQKRSRTETVGFDAQGKHINQMKVSSENQMTPVEGQEEGSSYDEIHGGTGNNLDRFELEFSISEILDKLKSQSKKYRFLQILMGHEDIEFTVWLQEKKIATRNEDNVDVQMKTSTEDFNRLLGEFLNVDERKLLAFIKRLRKDLALPENMRKNPKPKVSA